MKLADALFAPRAVALFGASADASKNTARPQRFLRKHGYTGRIVPINASRSEVLGERAWPSLADALVDGRPGDERDGDLGHGPDEPEGDTQDDEPDRLGLLAGGGEGVRRLQQGMNERPGLDHEGGQE